MVDWQIIGHEQMVAGLQNAQRTDTPAHAYLFSGRPGLGKRTLAERFAASLLCEQQDGPCEKCPQCRLRQAANHPDFKELRRDEKAGIDKIRQLKEWLSRRPHSATVRVALLTDADRLGIPAQNALLKVLEEPPPKTVLILTAPAASALLPTVISRCCQLPFALVPEEVVATALGVPLEEAAELARLSEGRPGVALALAQNPEKRVQLGEWSTLLLEVLEAPADHRLQIAKQLAEDDFRGAVLDHWLSLHRQAMQVGMGGEKEEGLALPAAQALSRRLTRAQLTANLRALVAAAAALRYNPNVLLLLETTLLKLGE